MVEKVATPIAVIIRQGVAEEVFNVDSIADTASVLMALLLGFQDRATDLFLARQAGTVSFAEAHRTFESFRSAFERILGARPGSIQVVDQRTLDEWFG